MRKIRLLICVVFTSVPSVVSLAQTNATSSNGVIGIVEGQISTTQLDHVLQTNGSAVIDWEKVEKDDEDRLRNPRPSDWPLPNFQTGPGRPLPSYLNFYGISDSYPAYLLCEYNIDETNYSQVTEPKWFENALKQVRQLGPTRFPPIKWVAVIVINRAEWHDVRTFEQAHKVGAIFDANDVFNSSCDLSLLVARTEVSRHPFNYDTTQSTPGDQQRWLIVEQHAATNRVNAGPK